MVIFQFDRSEERLKLPVPLTDAISRFGMVLKSKLSGKGVAGAPEGLHGHETRALAVSKDAAGVTTPIRYDFRSFDRQWIIPDSRLINQPNPSLWAAHSRHQNYLTAPHDRTPANGPALTFAAVIPDLHHYAGWAGAPALG